MAKDPYSTIPGHRLTSNVRDDAVGGAIVVLDTREKAKILPDIHHPERWAVMHVDGDLHSAKAIHYKTVLNARDMARKIAKGESEIQLKSLKSDKMQKPKVEESSEIVEESGVREGEGGKEIQEREPEEDPAQEAEVAYYGPSDFNNQLHAAIAKRITPDRIANVLDGMLKAEKPVYTQGVIVGHVPDRQARQFALSYSANYTVGRPTKRMEVTERKKIDYAEIRDRMKKSPQYRKVAIEILEEAANEENGD